MRLGDAKKDIHFLGVASKEIRPENAKNLVLFN